MNLKKKKFFYIHLLIDYCHVSFFKYDTHTVLRISVLFFIFKGFSLLLLFLSYLIIFLSHVASYSWCLFSMVLKDMFNQLSYIISYHIFMNKNQSLTDLFLSTNNQFQARLPWEKKCFKTSFLILSILSFMCYFLSRQ